MERGSALVLAVVRVPCLNVWVRKPPEPKEKTADQQESATSIFTNVKRGHTWSTPKVRTKRINAVAAEEHIK